ncbi:MAG: hypothetical protein HY927_16550 [Elusimicrobia bacterium]|nr:hypothetical protein [Elusimicrobiota bacterium]
MVSYARHAIQVWYNRGLSRATRVSLAYAALILAVKWIVIRLVAIDLPFYDQWDGEVDALFPKYLNHALELSSFITPANEHRIVYTRLLNLAVFILGGGRFNALWTIGLQAVVHAAIGFFVLRRLNGVRVSHPLSCVAALLFMWPVSGENYFWSYQSQVYFQICFTLYAIRVLSKPDHDPFHVLVVTGAASVNMATTLIIPVLACVACLHYYRRSGDRRYLSRVPAFLAAAFVLYRLIPFNPAHEAMKASSVPEFLEGLWRYVAWPGGLGLLVLPPFVVLSRRLFVEKGASEREVFSYLTLVWVFGLMALGSYGRKGGIPERHLDYLVMGFAAALWAWHGLREASPALRRWSRAAAFAAAAYPAGVVAATFADVAAWADRFREGRAVVVRALEMEAARPGSARAFVLSQQPYLYPSNERLYALIAKPETARMFRSIR